MIDRTVWRPWTIGIGAIGGIGIWLLAQPAWAHHPLEGSVPANFLEGFASGLAHPIIGLDHLAFIVAVGLLAAVTRQGIGMPTVFVLAGLLGTGMHLAAVDLPAPEFVISTSVVGIGLVLALGRQLPLAALATLAAIAGIFHGYAYGEAILGAEITPLSAYLAGFTLIQLVLSLGALGLGRLLLKQSQNRPGLGFRFSGFTILGIGTTLLMSVFLG